MLPLAQPYQRSLLSFQCETEQRTLLLDFKFLVDSCVYNVQIKENIMNYFFLGTNTAYDASLTYNNYMPTYFYPTYQNYGVMGNLFQNQSLPNYQLLYASNQWIIPEMQNPDTKDRSLESSQINSQENEKISHLIENQRKSRNAQKQLESAKKNCESNLVNQFLSYFSSFNNSSCMIIKALKKMKLEKNLDDQKDYDKATLFFCKQISIVNSRRERKYVNKALLMNYFTVQKLQKYMPDILEKVNKFQLLTKEQFCQLFRRCCLNFFRTISVSSVTSSAKLHKISRPEHIKRRRLIVQTLEKR